MSIMPLYIHIDTSIHINHALKDLKTKSFYTSMQKPKHLVECLCRSQWRNLRRFSTLKSLLINLIAFANSARRTVSRGFLSRVCWSPTIITTKKKYQENSLREHTSNSLNFRYKTQSNSMDRIHFSINAERPTLIKFNISMGFPYLLARFSKWSLVAS